jgi:hypothetical protein
MRRIESFSAFLLSMLAPRRRKESVTTTGLRRQERKKNESLYSGRGRGLASPRSSSLRKPTRWHVLPRGGRTLERKNGSAALLAWRGSGRAGAGRGGEIGRELELVGVVAAGSLALCGKGGRRRRGAVERRGGGRGERGARDVRAKGIVGVGGRLGGEGEGGRGRRSDDGEAGGREFLDGGARREVAVPQLERVLVDSGGSGLSRRDGAEGEEVGLRERWSRKEGQSRLQR